jgi:hypothetical protein
LQSKRKGAASHDREQTGIADRTPGLARGVTIFGDTHKIVARLRALRVPLSEVEFFSSSEWALYVKPGAISLEQSDMLRRDFQVSPGRC